MRRTIKLPKTLVLSDIEYNLQAVLDRCDRETAVFVRALIEEYLKLYFAGKRKRFSDRKEL